MGKIVDAGEKIGGARKDFAADPLSLRDLEAMSEAEAVSLVTKNAVWPEPDWAKLVEAGMSREQAAFAKVVRSKAAATPVPRGVKSGAETRRLYVETLSIVREVAETPISAKPAEVSAAIAEAVRKRFPEMARDCGAIVPNKQRVFPFSLGLAEHRRVLKMLAEGFPEKTPAWRRNLRYYRGRDDKIVLVRGNVQIGQGFETPEEALAFAERSYRSPEKPTPDSGLPPLPVRPHLDRLERSGPDRRGGRDIDAERFVEDLGFRGVEFGNWLPQDERQTVLNQGWDAIHDLADVMGVDPRAISLGGTLAAAFGSRGKGGTAAAHYEPGRRVFNLTRLNGAGTLAHEFAHALDHALGEMLPEQRGGRGVRGASGWHFFPSDPLGYLAPLGEEIAQTMAELLRTMREHDLPEDVVAERRLKEIARLESVIARQKMMIAQAGRPRLRRAEEERLAGYELHLARLRSDGFRGAIVTSTRSDFLGQAVALDRGRRKPYYALPNEMFARSFETWVFDRLAQDGRRNDYLVFGVEEGRFAGPDVRGDPYPAGEERRDLGVLHDRLAQALAPVLGAGMAAPETRPAPRP